MAPLWIRPCTHTHARYVDNDNNNMSLLLFRQNDTLLGVLKNNNNNNNNTVASFLVLWHLTPLGIKITIIIFLCKRRQRRSGNTVAG